MEENGKSNWWMAAALGVGAVTAAAMWGKARREYVFKDKVVLITGGSRGLGLVMARRFAEEGARLAICARNSEELARARLDLESRGAQVFDTVCDVRNQSEVDQMIDRVRNRYGRIDVLVNNAGVIQVGPLAAQTKQDFKEAMDVHFWGPFYTMNAVIPEMRERGDGRIINISSIGGKIPVPHLAPYCASKFALAGLSGAIRAELAGQNVFVTTVSPGLMRTGSHINALFKGQNDLEYAWFSIGNGFPLSSINAERAAEQIINACRRGAAETVISIQARAAVKLHQLFPELSADMASLINRLLPATGGIGKAITRGKNSQSWLSPSILTALVDKESARNNELRPGEQIA